MKPNRSGYPLLLIASCVLSMPLSGCRARNPETSSSTSGFGAVLSDQADRNSAFANLRAELEKEAQEVGRVETVPVLMDDQTDAAAIVSILPPKNLHPAPGNETPKNLQGVFWMRGNPLPDYLISFANLHFTNVNGTTYTYLPTFAPGSFSWKEKMVATGAPSGDFKFLPEICRVPKSDDMLQKIARHKSTYDPTRFSMPIADDMKLINANPADEVASAQSEKFLSATWQAGQQDADGGASAQSVQSQLLYYESRVNDAANEAVVVVFGLKNRNASGVPSSSFSMAPHTLDKDIFMRKSFVPGVSKMPNYYLMTRIVDGDGQATPHFQEFIECAKERSKGRVLKVQKKN